MNKIKPFVIASLMGLMMTGCANLQSTTQHIPSELQQQLMTSQPIIAYFTPDAGEEENCGCNSNVGHGYSATPVENGYYRKLLGRDKNGRFLVQDFYQNSHNKQTDPFWMIEPKGLNSFEGQYTDGDVVGYYENGKVEFKSTYQNQVAIGKSENYYPNGQIALKTEFIDEKTVLQKLWYENGKIAADLKMDAEQDFQIIDSKVWDQNGNVISDIEQSDEIIQQIYSQI